MTDASSPIRVLLIDDDPRMSVVVRHLLGAAGDGVYLLEHRATWEDGLEAVLHREHDAYLVDQDLGGRSGVDLIREALSRGVDAPMVVLTSHAARALDGQALMLGAADFLPKADLSADLLDRSLRYSFQHARVLRERTSALGEVRKAHGDLLAILDGLDTGIILVDPAGCVSFANRSAEGMLRQAAAALTGRSWRDAFPFGDADLDRLAALGASPAAERTPILVPVPGADDELRWFEVGVQADPRHPDGRIWSLVDRSEVQGLRRLLEEGGRFHRLIGRSAAMAHVYQQIEVLAPAAVTVLILGESGTGKELVARSIHEASPRSGRPFVAVNCAGLSESLLASQLFGHRRGAFTGAIDDHRGFFEVASGGTLFLDEIGDFPHSVQASMLRVLQEREILRVGDATPRKVDVRIIAATHRDLERLIKEGLFRLDLYYRLKVAAIRLPAVQDRREDIPLLASSFLRTHRLAAGSGPAAIAPSALARLMAHDWPGNVRELHSVIEVAAIRARGSWIEAADLDLPATVFCAPAATESEEDESERFRRAIAAAGGNRTAAARSLGMSRATFYRHLVRLRIDAKE